ncbi:MAG: tRNA adenosine(34) deaminase TadA [Nitrospiria bacterium]
MYPTDQDKRFMRQALAAAREASEKGEVPVGAVLVCDEKAVFTAHNLKECLRDPTAHAEMLALREAAEKLGRWRLGGTLYATLEPCVMCAGALVQARIDRLFYGAIDPKGGGCGSVLEVVREPRFNHQIEVIGGFMSEASERVLQAFFDRLRGRKDRRITQPIVS